MRFRQIKTSSFFKHWLILISLAILFAGCGGGQSANNSTADSGALRFSLSLQDTDSRQADRTAELDCLDEGIATIEISVFDDNDNLLSSGGPWECNVGQGTVSNVPAGNNRTVVVSGKSSFGDVVMRGEKNGITVLAGRTNNAGLIECNPFF